MKILIQKILVVQLFGFFATTLFAQDLEPRSLSSIPTGGNFLIASYGYSSGNILLDNTLPIENLNANINSAVVGYARSFKLFNKLAKFDAIVPYSFGSFEGAVSGIDSSTTRTGFGDPLLRVSMILIGAKPLKMSEFVSYKPSNFKLGINLRVKLPIGQYNETKFINLGSNRWAMKLGLAGSYSIQKRLIIEGQVNSWFFAKNTAFFNGNTIEQKPLLSGQIHATWIFKPGIWAAVSLGRSTFGETIINGVEKEDLKNSSRFGAAFAYRVSKHSSFKVAVTSGLSTRYGADFTSILVAYQFMWFDKIDN